MDFKCKYANKGYVSKGMLQDYEEYYGEERKRIFSPLREYELLKIKNIDLQNNIRTNRRGEKIADSNAMREVKRAMRNLTKLYALPMSMNREKMRKQLDLLSYYYDVLIDKCDKYTSRWFISQNSRYYLVKDIKRHAEEESRQLEKCANNLFNRALKMEHDVLPKWASNALNDMSVQQSNMDINTNIITTENEEVINDDQNADCPMWANVLEAMHTTSYKLNVNHNECIEERTDTEYPVMKITKKEPQESLIWFNKEKKQCPEGLILEDVRLSSSNEDLKKSITKYFKKGGNPKVIADENLEKYIEFANIIMTKLLDLSKYDKEEKIEPGYPSITFQQRLLKEIKEAKYLKNMNKYLYLAIISSREDSEFRSSFLGECRQFLKEFAPFNEEVLDLKKFQNVMFGYFSEYFKRLWENEEIATGAGLTSKVNLTRRNVAMYYLAELFGIGNLVTPATCVQYKFPKQEEKSGVLITKPTGIDIYEYSKECEENEVEPILSPGCMLQLNTLQIFDLICGMKDRPMNDILLNISPQTGKAIGIQSIHNEASFGNLTIANNANKDSSDLILNNGVSIKCIDHNFYDRLMNIDTNMISMRLAGVTEPEYMNALLTRLEQIKKAIKEAVKKSEEKILVYPSDRNKPEDKQVGCINDSNSMDDEPSFGLSNIFPQKDSDPVEETKAFQKQKDSYVDRMLDIFESLKSDNSLQIL